MKMFSPLSKRFCLPVKLYHSIAACVVCLLFTSGPLAIGKLIVSICANSFQCMFMRWRHSHIMKEIIKLMPSLADLNSPAPIATKFCMFRILASLKHSTPNAVQIGTAKAVLKISVNKIVMMVAAAGMRAFFGFCKFSSCNYQLIAAITATKKLIIPVCGFSGNIYNGQSVESLSY